MNRRLGEHSPETCPTRRFSAIATTATDSSPSPSMLSCVACLSRSFRRTLTARPIALRKVPGALRTEAALTDAGLVVEGVNESVFTDRPAESAASGGCTTCLSLRTPNKRRRLDGAAFSPCAAGLRSRSLILVAVSLPAEMASLRACRRCFSSFFLADPTRELPVEPEKREGGSRAAGIGRNKGSGTRERFWVDVVETRFVSTEGRWWKSGEGSCAYRCFGFDDRASAGESDGEGYEDVCVSASGALEPRNVDDVTGGRFETSETVAGGFDANRVATGRRDRAPAPSLVE